MKYASVVLLLLFVTNTFAQENNRVMRQIKKNANIILSEVDYSYASHRELREALALIQNAKRIILGRGDTGNPQPPAVKMKCVARDDDGRSPWVLAHVTSDFRVIKNQNVKFNSKQNCESFSTQTVSISRGEVMCASKDGDDRAPWAMYLMRSGNISVLDELFFASRRECVDSMSAPVFNGKITFCAAKDADGSRPYIIAQLDTFTGRLSKIANQTFNTMRDCNSIIDGY